MDYDSIDSNSERYFLNDYPEEESLNEDNSLNLNSSSIE